MGENREQNTEHTEQVSAHILAFRVVLQRLLLEEKVSSRLTSTLRDDVTRARSLHVVATDPRLWRSSPRLRPTVLPLCAQELAAPP